jgi:hypothetical protein
MPRFDTHNRPHAMLSSSSKYVILHGRISKQVVLADNGFLLKRLLGKKKDLEELQAVY